MVAGPGHQLEGTRDGEIKRLLDALDGLRIDGPLTGRQRSKGEPAIQARGAGGEQDAGAGGDPEYAGHQTHVAG